VDSGYHLEGRGPTAMSEMLCYPRGKCRSFAGCHHHLQSFWLRAIVSL
jgi:hypothetical protein